MDNDKDNKTDERGAQRAHPPPFPESVYEFGGEAAKQELLSEQPDLSVPRYIPRQKTLEFLLMPAHFRENFREYSLDIQHYLLDDVHQTIMSLPSEWREQFDSSSTIPEKRIILMEYDSSLSREASKNIPSVNEDNSKRTSDNTRLMPEKSMGESITEDASKEARISDQINPAEDDLDLENLLYEMPTLKEPDYLRHPWIINEEIQQKTLEIVKDAYTSFEKAILVTEWVSNNVARRPGTSYTVLVGLKDAIETYNERADEGGVCAEHSYLATGMMRSLGVDAFYYHNIPKDTIGHALVAVYLDNKKILLADSFLDTLSVVDSIPQGYEVLSYGRVNWDYHEKKDRIRKPEEEQKEKNEEIVEDQTIPVIEPRVIMETTAASLETATAIEDPSKKKEESALPQNDGSLIAQTELSEATAQKSQGRADFWTNMYRTATALAAAGLLTFTCLSQQQSYFPSRNQGYETKTTQTAQHTEIQQQTIDDILNYPFMTPKQNESAPYAWVNSPFSTAASAQAKTPESAQKQDVAKASAAAAHPKEYDLPLSVTIPKGAYSFHISYTANEKHEHGIGSITYDETTHMMTVTLNDNLLSDIGRNPDSKEYLVRLLFRDPTTSNEYLTGSAFEEIKEGKAVFSVDNLIESFNEDNVRTGAYNLQVGVVKMMEQEVKKKDNDRYLRYEASVAQRNRSMPITYVKSEPQQEKERATADNQKVGAASESSLDQKISYNRPDGRNQHCLMASQTNRGHEREPPKKTPDFLRDRENLITEDRSIDGTMYRMERWGKDLEMYRMYMVADARA